MRLIDKTLWFINAHYQDPLSLEEIAEVVGLSRHHLARAFGEATGRSVMSYVRGLRLADAAKSLSAGAPDILAVALEAGYGSHEAFTRAFRDTFGETPESVRVRRSVSHLKLTEPLTMATSNAPVLKPPRLADGRTFTVAGLSQHYTFDGLAGIAAQWMRLVPHIGHIDGAVAGGIAYGVVSQADDDGCEYLCGVEVNSGAALPKDFVTVKVPAGRYLVFRHDGHVSAVRQTFGAIYGDYLPNSDHTAGDGPSFERYGPEFDGRTGEGGFEIWLPVTG